MGDLVGRGTAGDGATVGLEVCIEGALVGAIVSGDHNTKSHFKFEDAETAPVNSIETSSLLVCWVSRSLH